MIGPIQEPRRWPWPDCRGHTICVTVRHEGLSKSAAGGRLRIRIWAMSRSARSVVPESASHRVAIDFGRQTASLAVPYGVSSGFSVRSARLPISLPAHDHSRMFSMIVPCLLSPTNICLAARTDI